MADEVTKDGKRPTHVTVTSAIRVSDLENAAGAAELRARLGEAVYATALRKATAEGLLDVPEKPDWVDERTS